MNIANKLYMEMIEASKRAKIAAHKYNKLKEEIQAVERKVAANTKRVTSPAIATQKLDDRLDRDRELKSFYSAYTFWTSEVNRISALIQGTLAAKRLSVLIGETDS